MAAVIILLAHYDGTAPPSPITIGAYIAILSEVIQHFVNVDPSSANSMSSIPLPDEALRDALYIGLYTRSQATFDVNFVSNINAISTWENVTTLAVCSQCSDMSSRIQAVARSEHGEIEGFSNPLQANYWNLSLPNGYFLDTLPRQIINADSNIPIAGTYWYDFGITASPPNFQPLNSNQSAATIANFSMLYMPPNATNQASARAQECTLSICLQSRNATVFNATFSDDNAAEVETSVSTSSANANSFWYDAYRALWDFTKPSSTDYRTVDAEGSVNLTNQGTDFVVNRDIGMYLSLFLVNAFNGVHTMSNPHPFASSSSPTMFQTQSTNDVYQVLRDAFVADSTTGLTMPDVMSNIAKSLTKAMRERSGNVAQPPNYATEQIIIINVNWRWISLPVVSAGFVAVFFAVGSLTSHAGARTWKANVLAAMSTFLGDDEVAQLRKAGDVASLKARAKGMTTSLSSSDVALRKRRP